MVAVPPSRHHHPHHHSNKNPPGLRWLSALALIMTGKHSFPELSKDSESPFKSRLNLPSLRNAQGLACETWVGIDAPQTIWSHQDLLRWS